MLLMRFCLFVFFLGETDRISHFQMHTAKYFYALINLCVTFLDEQELVSTLMTVF